jgi:hypothetical protein
VGLEVQKLESSNIFPERQPTAAQTQSPEPSTKALLIHTQTLLDVAAEELHRVEPHSVEWDTAQPRAPLAVKPRSALQIKYETF